MGTFLGVIGLVLFGLALVGLGVITLIAMVRTLRLETLPRFSEARPGPLDRALTLLASVGLQLLISGFMLAAGLRALQVALRA